MKTSWKTKYHRLLKKHRKFKMKVKDAVYLLGSTNALYRMAAEEQLGVKTRYDTTYNWYERGVAQSIKQTAPKSSSPA